MFKGHVQDLFDKENARNSFCCCWGMFGRCPSLETFHKDEWRVFKDCFTIWENLQYTLQTGHEIILEINQMWLYFLRSLSRDPSFCFHVFFIRRYIQQHIPPGLNSQLFNYILWKIRWLWYECYNASQTTLKHLLMDHPWRRTIFHWCGSLHLHIQSKYTEWSERVKGFKQRHVHIKLENNKT